MADIETDRLDDVAERLDAALRRLHGSGSAVAQSREQGERLRRRHRELKAHPGEGHTLEHDIKALEDAVDRWVNDVDQRFSAA